MTGFYCSNERHRLKLALFLSLLLLPGTALAQHEHHAAPGGTIWVSRYTGLSHPTATRNTEAQKLFDQGLLLTYAFNHDAAIAVFLRAAALDPGYAMAHWGIALALGANINSPVTADRAARAHAAIERAHALAAINATELDRAYIAAMRLRYTADPKAPREPLDRAYADAMRAIAARYPDDGDAATLYADALMNLNPWRYWTLDGRATADTPEILAALERVLRRDPDHVGANHYYIHAIEASPFPERGLAAAYRLDALGLDTGHLAHMPSHIHLRLGDYDALVRSNERAVEADRSFFDATGKRSGAYPGYFAHNLEFLAVGNSFRGHYGKAIAAADAFNEVIDGIIPRAPRAEHKYTRRMSVLLRFGKWNEILLLPDPGETRPISRAFWHYARGSALAALGETRRAKAEHEALLAARAKVSAETRISQNGAGEILDIAHKTLAGRIAASRKDYAEASRLLREAVTAQDLLAYDEPPNWYYPVRETLGVILLRGGQEKEAEAVFREDLERNPRNPRSLFGLARSLEAQGRREESQRVDAQFDKSWQSADGAINLNHY